MDEIHYRIHLLRPPGECHAADAQDCQYDRSNSERTHLEKINSAVLCARRQPGQLAIELGGLVMHRPGFT